MIWSVTQPSRSAILIGLGGTSLVAIGVGCVAAFIAAKNIPVLPGAGDKIVPIAAAFFTLANGLLVACNLLLQRIDSAENRRRLLEVEAKEDRRRDEDELRELVRAFQTIMAKLETTTVRDHVFQGTEALRVLSEISREPVHELERIIDKLSGQPKHAGSLRLITDLVAIRGQLAAKFEAFRAESARGPIATAMLSALSSVEREVLDGASEIPAADPALQ